MSDDFPDSSVGRPNYRNLGIRRMTKAPLIAVGVMGVVVAGVVVYTAVQKADRAGHIAAVKKTTTETEATAPPLTPGVPTHGTIRAKLPPSPSIVSPSKAAGVSPSMAGDKIQSAKSKADTERDTMVREAWIAYIQGLIHHNVHVTNRERLALSSATDISAASPLSAALGGAASGAHVSDPVSPAGDPPNGSEAVTGTMAGNVGGGPLGGFGGFGGYGQAGIAPGLGGATSGAGFNGESGKSAFLGALRGNPDYLPTTRQAPISPDVLRAGAVIPAVMIGGINSDLPGQIIAEVSQNVYNTANGNILLIPQGAKLVGTYDNQVSQGQTRVLVAWTRIIYPDGSSLDIGSMPGADQAGYGGFHDEVNNHYFRIFGDALLLSLFSAGVQLSQPQANGNSVYSSQQVISGALGQQLGETGQNLINRDINIQPTLKIRPGYKFDVMVTRDLVIQPWSGK